MRIPNVLILAIVLAAIGCFARSDSSREGRKMGEIVQAVPTRFSPEPLSRQILAGLPEGQQERVQVLSQSLARALDKPVYVSWGVILGEGEMHRMTLKIKSVVVSLLKPSK